MAKIVLGMGTSHSPLLVLGGARWEFRSGDDRRNKSLNTLDGRLLSYDELVAERGEHFVKESDPAGFPALAKKAEAALDRLAAELRRRNRMSYWSSVTTKANCSVRKTFRRWRSTAVKSWS
jgi:hypothetical protein